MALPKLVCDWPRRSGYFGKYVVIIPRDESCWPLYFQQSLPGDERLHMPRYWPGQQRLLTDKAIFRRQCHWQGRVWQFTVRLETSKALPQRSSSLVTQRQKWVIMQKRQDFWK